MEKQPKVLTSKSPKAQYKVVPRPNYAILQMKHMGDASSKRLYRMFVGKFPFTLIQFIDPLLNQ